MELEIPVCLLRLRHTSELLHSPPLCLVSTSALQVLRATWTHELTVTTLSLAPLRRSVLDFFPFIVTSHPSRETQSSRYPRQIYSCVQSWSRHRAASESLTYTPARIRFANWRMFVRSPFCVSVIIVSSQDAVFQGNLASFLPTLVREVGLFISNTVWFICCGSYSLGFPYISVDFNYLSFFFSSVVVGCDS